MSDYRDDETPLNNEWLMRPRPDNLPKHGYIDVPGQGHYVVSADPLQIVWFPTIHIPPSPEAKARRDKVRENIKRYIKVTVRENTDE